MLSVKYRNDLTIEMNVMLAPEFSLDFSSCPMRYHCPLPRLSMSHPWAAFSAFWFRAVSSNCNQGNKNFRRHHVNMDDIETFSTLLALCEGNSAVMMWWWKKEYRLGQVVAHTHQKSEFVHAYFIVEGVPETGRLIRGQTCIEDGTHRIDKSKTFYKMEKMNIPKFYKICTPCCRANNQLN